MNIDDDFVSRENVHSTPPTLPRWRTQSAKKYVLIEIWRNMFWNIHLYTLWHLPREIIKRHLKLI